MTLDGEATQIKALLDPETLKFLKDLKVSIGKGRWEQIVELRYIYGFFILFIIYNYIFNIILEFWMDFESGAFSSRDEPIFPSSVNKSKNYIMATGKEFSYSCLTLSPDHFLIFLFE